MQSIHSVGQEFPHSYYEKYPGTYFLINESGDFSPQPTASLLYLDSMVVRHLSYLYDNPKSLKPETIPKLESLQSLSLSNTQVDYRSAFVELSAEWSADGQYRLMPGLLQKHLTLARDHFRRPDIDPTSTSAFNDWERAFSRMVGEQRVLRACFLKLAHLMLTTGAAKYDACKNIRSYLTWMRDDLKINSSFAVGACIHGLNGNTRINKFLKLGEKDADPIKSSQNAAWDVYHATLFGKRCQERYETQRIPGSLAFVPKTVQSIDKFFVTEDVAFSHVFNLSSTSEMTILEAESSSMTNLHVPVFKDSNVDIIVDEYVNFMSLRALSRMGPLPTAHLDDLISNLEADVKRLGRSTERPPSASPKPRV